MRLLGKTGTDDGRDIAYIRASTLKQELSPEAQRRRIEEIAAMQGRAIDVWAEDPATTSKIRFDKRPGGREVMRIARKGDTIWLSSMDRAFRSLADFALTVDKWERLGIGVRFTDIIGQFDIQTAQGKAFLQMLAVFAEYERKMISIRTREALAVAKKKNQAVGKYAGYGFKWEKQHDAARGKRVKVRVPNPEERAVMAQIASWRLAGYDFEHIANHLRKLKVVTPEGNPWSVDRVKRAYLAEMKLQAGDNPKQPVR